MSLILGEVIPDQLVFSVLEIEKLNFSCLFGIYLHCLPVLFSTQVSDIGPSWSSCFVFEVLKSKVSVFQTKDNGICRQKVRLILVWWFTLETS